MQADYDVELILAFSDREAVTAKVRECLRSMMQTKRVNFSVTDEDIDKKSLPELLSVYLPDILDDAGTIDQNGPNIFHCYSSFKTNFEYGSILHELFAYLAPILDNGSSIDVDVFKCGIKLDEFIKEV